MFVTTIHKLTCKNNLCYPEMFNSTLADKHASSCFDKNETITSIERKTVEGKLYSSGNEN